MDQPNYPQMIMEAVEAGRANKTEISSYIEQTNPDLPPAHSSLLFTALDKMVQSGQLVFNKDTYSVPDPNATPKRGRGRPPKPKKDGPPTVTYTGPPRGRGRPPKARDPLAPLSQPKKVASSPSGRPRGRPRKNPPSQNAAVVGVKRGRGRPPKNA